MLLLCSKVYLKPHIPLRVRTTAFSFLLAQNMISHITMHIQCWIWFSDSIFLFIYVSFFLSCNFSRCTTGIWFPHHTATHQLFANLLYPNCSWIIPLNWSQQNTVAKELEVIVISHILTRAKDAFVWNHYCFFSLRVHKFPNTNCNKILCIWELVHYLCGDTEYNIHSTLLERNWELVTKKEQENFSGRLGHGSADDIYYFTTTACQFSLK